MNSTLKTLTTLASGSLAALAIASGASAATLSYNQNIPSQATPFPSPFNFTLPSFNTALGTLTGVTIRTTVNTTGVVSVINTTPTVQNFTNANSSTTLGVTAPTQIINTTATAVLASGSVPAGFSQTNFPGQTATQVSDTNILSANFGSYTGGPGVNLSFSANALAGSYTGTANAGVFFGGSADVGGNVQIIYTYSTPTSTSVPEPSTVLGLLAFGGLGFASRRRKS